jgi:hypothetical protein
MLYWVRTLKWLIEATEPRNERFSPGSNASMQNCSYSCGEECGQCSLESH